MNVCSLCVSVLNLFLRLWRLTGRGEDFFPQDIWEWWIRKRFHFVRADHCLKTFLEGGRESLNLDTEKEAALAVVIPQRQITCWIRGVEFTFIAVDQDSSDHHKTRFNFFLGETVMTAESVCVSVSLTPLCY